MQRGWIETESTDDVLVTRLFVAFMNVKNQVFPKKMVAAKSSDIDPSSPGNAKWSCSS